MNMQQLKSPLQVKTEFEMLGVPIAEWAREHGFSLPLVYRVLRGEGKHLRGETHRIAVLLGIKQGVIASATSISQMLNERPAAEAGPLDLFEKRSA